MKAIAVVALGLGLAAASAYAGQSKAMSEKVPAELLERSQSGQHIRVIVKTQAVTQPLSASMSETRGVAASDGAAQLMIIHSLPADEQQTAEPLTDNLLAVEVGPATLEALSRSPLVAAVQEDVPVGVDPIEGGEDEAKRSPEGATNPGGGSPDLASPQ